MTDSAKPDVFLRRNHVALIGLSVLLLLALIAWIAPSLTLHDPAMLNLRARLRPPVWLEGGSWAYPLGTDQLGRDVASRLIAGARISLLVGLAVVLIAGGFGVLVGLVSGYFGGRLDQVLMRWVDAHIAFPGLLLALVIVAALGPSVASVTLALAVNGWMVFAQMTRNVVLSVKERPYVEAAAVIGAGPGRILFRHVLPNLAAPLSTLAVLEFARFVLAEAALSFLGLGVQAPETSWGLDVANGRNYISTAWWLVTFPGLAIALVVLGVNLFAGWLRIASDPRESDKAFARALAAKAKV